MAANQIEDLSGNRNAGFSGSIRVTGAAPTFAGPHAELTIPANAGTAGSGRDELRVRFVPSSGYSLDVGTINGDELSVLFYAALGSNRPHGVEREHCSSLPTAGSGAEIAVVHDGSTGRWRP